MSFDEIVTIIRSDDSKKLREIIEGGRVSDVNMKNENLQSLLMIACRIRYNSIGCVKVLLDHNSDINYTYQNHTVLKSACLGGNVDMLNLIIERGVIINDSVIQDLFESKDVVRDTKIATILVKYIEDVNFWLEGRNDFLYIAACQAGNVAITRILLERGALVRPGNPDLLLTAARGGHLEMVKVLLGCNMNGRISPDSVKEALQSASMFGRMEIVRCLVEYGADDDALNCALSWAASGNKVKLITYLIDCGADPNAEGLSPLSAAWRQPDTLRTLLKCGADPNLFSRNDSTLLIDIAWYSFKDYKETLTILLEYGADPNLAHTTTGTTPLMKAALKLNIDMVKMLLEHGADVTQVDRGGKSVLDMLRLEKYKEVRELCTQYIECNKPGAEPVLK